MEVESICMHGFVWLNVPYGTRYIIEISGNRYCRNEVSILVKPVDKLMQIWEKDCLFKRFYCHLKRSHSKAPMQSFLDCPTMQPLNGRSRARVQSTKPKVIFRSEREALIYDRPWIMILRSAKAAAETSWKSPSVNTTNSTRSIETIPNKQQWGQLAVFAGVLMKRLYALWKFWLSHLRDFCVTNALHDHRYLRTKANPYFVHDRKETKHNKAERAGQPIQHRAFLQWALLFVWAGELLAVVS